MAGGRDGAAGATVALIGLHRDVDVLVEHVLADEGHRVWRPALALDPLTVVEQAAVAGTDLVILGARRGEDVAVLIGAFRVAAQAAPIPIVLLGTMDARDTPVRASGAVVAAIGIPFDLDDLTDAVRAALS